MLLKSGQEKKQACLLGVAEWDDLFWTHAGRRGPLNLIWEPQRLKNSYIKVHIGLYVPVCAYMYEWPLLWTFISINYLSVWKMMWCDAVSTNIPSACQTDNTFNKSILLISAHGLTRGLLHYGWLESHHGPDQQWLWYFYNSVSYRNQNVQWLARLL